MNFTSADFIGYHRYNLDQITAKTPLPQKICKTIKNQRIARDILRLIGIIGTLTASAQSVAQSNIREACRQSLGGAYLKVYDEKNRAHDYAIMLTESLTSTQAALAAAIKDAKTARLISERAGYDVNKAVARDHAAARVDMLKDQEKQNSELLQQAKVTASKQDLEEQRLRQELSEIFIISRHEDQKDGGYPLQIQYKSPCPKYRYLCTLPATDAHKLQKIRIDGQLPQPCARYVEMSMSR